MWVIIVNKIIKKLMYEIERHENYSMKRVVISQYRYKIQ